MFFFTSIFFKKKVISGGPLVKLHSLYRTTINLNRQIMKKLYILILITLSSHSIFAQTIRYVKPVATGAGNGSSWLNASSDLQAMINASASGDRVWVAKGTYYPTEKIAAVTTGGTNSIKRDQSFILRTGVKVYGGFVGDELSTYDLLSRDFTTNETILSGDLGNASLSDGDGLNTNNAYHVVTARIDAAGTEKAILDGFSIQDGYASATGILNAGQDIVRNQGAAINLAGVAASTKIEFNNLIIKNNEVSVTTGAGGAVYISAEGTGTLKFSNTRFVNNKSAASGAAVYFVKEAGQPNIVFDKVIFEGNINGTTTTRIGGAIYYANAYEADGTTVGTLTIKNSKFISNTSGGFAGAVGMISGSASIVNSSFYNNKSGSSAGAIYISTGGTKAAAIITNCTFYKNEAATTSGAISFYGSASATLDLNNSIFNGNVATTNYPDIRDDFNLLSLSYKNNLFQVFNKSIAGRHENNITEPNPSQLFASTVPTDLNFLHLVEGSATEKGNVDLYNELGDANVDTDLAGNPRLKHANIDLGAYEFQGTLPVTLQSYYAIKKGSTAVITWKTKSEQNNQKFVVERGSSATNFTFFKEVAGAGDSSTPLSYAVTDYTPLAGVNYYRLTQYDKDGTSKVLGTDAVNFDLTTEKTTVYPNPARTYVNVKSNSSENIISLNLISLTGKTILTNNYAQSAANEGVKLELADIPSGTYILWINKGKPNAEKQTLLVVK